MDRTRPGLGGLGYLLYGASNVVRTQFTDNLRALGLDHDMWMMLQSIRLSGEAGANPIEAAAINHAGMGGFVDAADRLVRDGWAKPMSRGAGPNARLVLTKKAEEALPGILSTGTFLLEHATSGFTHDEVEALAGYLTRIIDNMA